MTTGNVLHGTPTPDAAPIADVAASVATHPAHLHATHVSPALVPDLPRQPTLSALDQDSCLGVLLRQRVGRLALAVPDRIDIHPVTYAYSDRFLYGRARHSDTLESLPHEPRVAFEVDEVRGAADWTSVVVRGTFYRLDHDVVATHDGQGDGHPDPSGEQVVPAALRLASPADARTVLFRISVDEVAGRQSTPEV